jgi:type I restriction enzyme M protein
MPKLKKSELKKHLLHSVQIFRVSLDYTVYCYFILATLFVYHLDANPGYGRNFQITRISFTATGLPTPGGQRKRKDARDELVETFSSIETYIPTLKGVLLPAIPTSFSDEALLEYQTHLDQFQRETGVFSASEPFSQAFEYWIGQFASMTLKRGLSLYTPRPLARLLVQMIRPEAGMTIYDPSARTGGMLLCAANYIRQNGRNLDNTYFYGREQSSDLWAICKMNLLAQQIENSVIEQGNPLVETFDQVDTFDIVLQNLPLAPDPANRVQTRRMYAAFLRHIVESLSPTGRAGVLFPSSVLQQNHQDIWRLLVGRDWLEAVITLPPNVLHGTNSAASVLVINKRKPAEHRLGVLFVNLASQVMPSRSRRLELTDADLQPVVQAFESWENIPDFSRVIPVSQIEAYNYSLTMDRYPDLNEEAQTFNFPTLLNRYQSAMQKREAALNQLMKTLEDLHYSSSSAGDETLLT